MMDYPYSISVDCPSGLTGGLLHDEIEADGTIGSLFVGLRIKGDSLKVMMTQALSAGEKTTLDGLIAAHAPAVPDQSCGAGNFGKVFFKQVLTESTTATKDSWKTKCTLNLKDLPAGKYRIECSFLWGYSTIAGSFQARIKVDTDSPWRMEQEPKDNSDDLPAFGKVYVTLTAGDHDIKLQFKSSSNGDTARMLNAVLEVVQYRE